MIVSRRVLNRCLTGLSLVALSLSLNLFADDGKTVTAVSRNAKAPKMRNRFRATAEETGNVRLRWACELWDKDQIGFQLLRRQQLTDGTWGKWYSMGRNVFQPNLNEGFLRENKLSDVLQKLDSWKKSGNPTATDDMVKKLQSEPGGYAGMVALSIRSKAWGKLPERNSRHASCSRGSGGGIISLESDSNDG